MEKVYNFYGFGPQIKFWLKTIGTGRSAQLILENNTLSEPFELGRGHAQGNSPSPFLYNMAAQICIWKIELDPLIKSVYAYMNFLHQCTRYGTQFLIMKTVGKLRRMSLSRTTLAILCF